MVYKSILGKKIELASERGLHIIVKHPEIRPHLGKIPKVLSAPDIIKRSRIDKEARTR